MSIPTIATPEQAAEALEALRQEHGYVPLESMTGRYVTAGEDYLTGGPMTPAGAPIVFLATDSRDWKETPGDRPRQRRVNVRSVAVYVRDGSVGLAWEPHFVLPGMRRTWGGYMSAWVGSDELDLHLVRESYGDDPAPKAWARFAAEVLEAVRRDVGGWLEPLTQAERVTRGDEYAKHRLTYAIENAAHEARRALEQAGLVASAPVWRTQGAAAECAAEYVNGWLYP